MMRIDRSSAYQSSLVHMFIGRKQVGHSELFWFIERLFSSNSAGACSRLFFSSCSLISMCSCSSSTNLFRELFCHQSRMSLILVASWSNGNKRLTTASISNFTICLTAVAERRRRRKKRRQICFLEIWDKSCLFWKHISQCVYKDEECRIYTHTHSPSQWCHYEPFIGTGSMMMMMIIEKNLFLIDVCVHTHTHTSNTAVYCQLSCVYRLSPSISRKSQGSARVAYRHRRCIHLFFYFLCRAEKQRIQWWSTYTKKERRRRRRRRNFFFFSLSRSLFLFWCSLSR